MVRLEMCFAWRCFGLQKSICNKDYFLYFALKLDLEIMLISIDLQYTIKNLPQGVCLKV